MEKFESGDVSLPEQFRLAAEELRERLRKSYPLWGTQMGRDSVMHSFKTELRKTDIYKKMTEQDSAWTERMSDDLSQGAWDDYRYYAQREKRSG